MAARTKSNVGTEAHFSGICRGTVFAGRGLDVAKVMSNFPLDSHGTFLEAQRKRAEFFKDAAAMSQSRPFAARMEHLSGKAEEALGELLQDMKEHEQALSFMDTQYRQDLRRTVQGLADIAEIGKARSENALEITIILDTAFRGSAFGFSKIENTARIIRDAKIPFCGERDKMELLRKALKTDPRDISNHDERQFCASLFDTFGKGLVKESVAFLDFKENPHMEGRCGHKLGSQAYCFEMLKRAVPAEFLDNISSSTRMRDAVLNSVYTVAYRLMEDLRKAADGGEYLEDGQIIAVRTALKSDLNKLNERVDSLTAGLDALLEKVTLSAVEEITVLPDAGGADAAGVLVWTGGEALSIGTSLSGATGLAGILGPFLMLMTLSGDTIQTDRAQIPALSGEGSIDWDVFQGSWEAYEKSGEAIIDITWINDNLDKTVKEILKSKRGNIKKAPKKPGDPDWNSILELTLAEILRRAQDGDKGFARVYKLLTDLRFNK